MTMGSAVDLHYLLEGPEEAPVLVLSNSLGTTLSMWDELATVLGERFRLLRYDHRWHGGSPVPPGPYKIEDLGRDVLVLLDTPDEGYAGCCEAVRDADLGDRLGTISAPTLVIAGADDPAAPPDQAELIRTSIPEASLEVIPDAAHLANIERTEAITQAIVDHLSPIVREER
jgi:3-oxoadipate enol-lactonase